MTTRRGRKNQDDNAEAREAVKRGEGLGTVTAIADAPSKRQTWIVSKTNNAHYWAWRCLAGPCEAGSSYAFSERTATADAMAHVCEWSKIEASS